MVKMLSGEFRLAFLIRMVLSLTAVGVLASCSAGLPTRDVAVKTSFEVKKEVVFTPAGWPQELKGNLYLPKSEKPAPGVLLIHGGGWTGGDKRSQMSSIARRLAKRGYVTFNVTYRSAPQYQHPAQYDDLVQALKWMRAHAKELNLDPDRLATFGYSAGGHLSALVGLQAEEEGIPIRAIVAGGAPADLTITDSPLVESLMGGSKSKLPEKFRDASPVSHVSPESPPVFLYHAPKDDLVWPVHVRPSRKSSLRTEWSMSWSGRRGRGIFRDFCCRARRSRRPLPF